MASIFYRAIGETLETDELVNLADIRQSCPLFFFNKVKGARETYTVHRGFLILRHTDHEKASLRYTMIWLFHKPNDSTQNCRLFLVAKRGPVYSILDAKLEIDSIIEKGQY